MENLLRSLPAFGDNLVTWAKRSEESLKAFFTPGMLFEALKFTYLGPVNGHRLDHLMETFKNVKNMKGPILVHVLTTKGKGYEPAETDPTGFHGLGKFDPDTGETKKSVSEVPPTPRSLATLWCAWPGRTPKLWPLPRPCPTAPAW